MISKYGWDKRTFDLIDWKLYEMGYNKLPAHKMVTTIKYIHGWQNVGAQKKQMGEEIECQRCKELETQHHYLTCQNPGWILKIKPAWDLLKSKLETLDTSPAIIATISALIAYRLHPDIANYMILHPLNGSEKILNLALHDQQKIGWKHFFLGRISKKWKYTQLLYWRQKHNKHHLPQGLMQKWESYTIPSLIKYGLDLWEIRNKELHGDTQLNQHRIHRSNTITRTKELLRQGSKMVPLGQ